MLVCSVLSKKSIVKIGNLDKCRKFAGAVYGFYEEELYRVCCHLN